MRICPHCKGEVKGRIDKVYCSRKCKWKASNLRNYGTTSPNCRTKKEKCGICGFIPENNCQMDKHHVDHNHNNNDPDNIQILCANCHRLVTYNHKMRT